MVTLDNLPAEIEIITKEPYQELTQTGAQDTPMTSTSFEEIGIKLQVTPHITKDNFISMQVSTQHSVKTGTSGGVPIVDVRTASTNVLVKDGETIVMGGLRRRDVADTVEKIPLLGDIPLFGWLFRSKDKTVTETELVLFITPHLIAGSELTTAEKIQLERARAVQELSAEVSRIKTGKSLFSSP